MERAGLQYSDPCPYDSSQTLGELSFNQYTHTNGSLQLTLTLRFEFLLLATFVHIWKVIQIWCETSFWILHDSTHWSIFVFRNKFIVTN